ncbi:hypothetical protein N2152v2_009064 [Parachlorella kessleri]
MTAAPPASLTGTSSSDLRYTGLGSGFVHQHDGAVVLLQPATRDSAAKLAEDGIHFLDSIGKLCSFASEYLAAVGEQADFVDQQKLRVAGLKTRLSKLAQDRRRMEQEFSQALAAKQAELARLSG